jgi:hypothetical protein
LASDHEATDVSSFAQLEQVVRGLGEELSNFRRRAHLAESRVRSLEAMTAAGVDPASLERLKALEAENAELKARLTYASQRAGQLMARIKFIRQQSEAAVSAGTRSGT